MKRIFDRPTSLQDVPSYYRPRRWRVRARLKFLLARPLLRDWADCHGLIVGVVNAAVLEQIEAHERRILRAMWFGDPEVSVNDKPVEGVIDFRINLLNEVPPFQSAGHDGNVTPLFARNRSSPQMSPTIRFRKPSE